MKASTLPGFFVLWNPHLREEEVGERRKVRVRSLRHQVSGFRGGCQFPPSAAVTTTA
jgi:hypothetical protein